MRFSDFLSFPNADLHVYACVFVTGTLNISLSPCLRLEFLDFDYVYPIFFPFMWVILLSGFGLRLKVEHSFISSFLENYMLTFSGELKFGNSDQNLETSL